ncbi:carotenoid oxygenase [Lophiostoma macrostomum CBS 122681]|uniref:Carotenoid oxygenase n=1 Tax=Lophiostoma macrostomum CBS 122681 TaxID=1314788 RepID=A0A6A6TI65_9PLEO|nr:carotenoid oxygenase [Lophiostoma macrostomum CBS 122681]
MSPSTQHTRRGLETKWPIAADLTGSGLPFRFEGEVADVIVYGEIPPEIDGTFYRISLDRFAAKENSVPIDGDGLISGFRIQNGYVDFKIKFVGTERYRLERSARKSLFGLYKNPWTHHPCVRAAVDSTGSTNVIRWAGKLLVLEEAGNPYEVNPDTLETIRYDPFADQVKAKAYTAHPKVDPFTRELVGFGYEAKGPGTKDIVTYALDHTGKKTEETWLEAPWCTITHDCVITKNWLVLLLWPYEASLERMKAGGNHWAYTPDRPACFVVVPRRKRSVAHWDKDEKFRFYNWKHCMNIHTAGAWEGDNGEIYLESTRVHGNVFPFFPGVDGKEGIGEAAADFVRWKIDPTQPSDSWLPDPEMILDLPSEFPRIDERFMSEKYKVIFLNVFIPQKADGSTNVFQGLNGLAMINTETRKQEFYYPGDNCFAQEPVFIPRRPDALEGDGWVMSLIEDRSSRLSELVFLDTRNFSKPIALAVLPFQIKSQVHGNWVEAKDLGERASLVDTPEVWPISHKGALEPL